MRLDDGQIERYSRQIVLPEVGAEGQSRLLEAHVAVVGPAPVAGDIVAQLIAGGVGSVAAPRPVCAAVAPGRASQVTPLEAASTGDPLDVVALIGTDARAPRAARHTLWLHDGRIGELPPCPACVARALPPAPACAPELAVARDTVLGALVATEIIKRLVDTGTPLAGRALTYEPATASVTVGAVAADPACLRCAPRTPEG